MSDQPAVHRGRRGPRTAAIGAAMLGVAAVGISTGATFATGTPSHSTKSHAATGSGLGALDVTAAANAMHMPMYSHQSEDVEADLPYSLSTLGTGGIGNALTSIMWPGGTGAHGGDTASLLGLPLPKSTYELMNDPEYAQAQTGVGDKSVDLSKPGLTMRANAVPTNVNAVTEAAGKAIPVLGPIVGSTRAETAVKVAGAATVKFNALSTVHDITIAKVIKIGTVTSIARGTTIGGGKATGTAKTIVSGMTIAGVPVTIDQKGLHVKGTSLPLVGNTAAKAVNAALKQSGISLQLTNTKHNLHGSHATLDSGALVVKFGNAQYKSGSNDTGELLVIGGANVDATARKAYQPPPIKPTPTPTQTQSTSHPTTTTTTTGGNTGGGGPIPAVQQPPSSPVTTDGGPTTAPPPVLASNPLSLPNSLGVWWFVIGLLGAGLMAFGMRRLPDKVLQTAGGKACNLEE
jgi:hypothetical protein